MFIENMGYIKCEKYQWKNKNFHKKEIQTLNTIELKKYISNYDYLSSFIKFDKKNIIFSIDAKYLISPLNFDFFAKYLYVLNKLYSLENNFIKQLYIEHLKAFNNFIEPEGTKNSKEDFINSFDYLINSFNQKEFNFNQFILPISTQNILIDGSHRLACAVAFNQKIRCVQLKIDDLKFDYTYFRNRKLKTMYLDYMALQIKNIVPNTACLLIQYDNNFNDIKKYIYEHYDAYYIKKIKVDIRKINLILDTKIYSPKKRNTFLFAIVKNNNTSCKYSIFTQKEKIDILCNLFLNKNSLLFFNKTEKKQLEFITQKIKENSSLNTKYVYIFKENKINFFSDNTLVFEPNELLYICNICFYKDGVKL